MVTLCYITYHTGTLSLVSQTNKPSYQLKITATLGAERTSVFCEVFIHNFNNSSNRPLNFILDYFIFDIDQYNKNPFGRVLAINSLFDLFNRNLNKITYWVDEDAKDNGIEIDRNGRLFVKDSEALKPTIRFLVQARDATRQSYAFVIVRHNGWNGLSTPRINPAFCFEDHNVEYTYNNAHNTTDDTYKKNNNNFTFRKPSYSINISSFDLVACQKLEKIELMNDFTDKIVVFSLHASADQITKTNTNNFIADWSYLFYIERFQGVLWLVRPQKFVFDVFFRLRVKASLLNPSSSLPSSTAFTTLHIHMKGDLKHLKPVFELRNYKIEVVEDESPGCSTNAPPLLNFPRPIFKLKLLNNFQNLNIPIEVMFRIENNNHPFIIQKNEIDVTATIYSTRLLDREYKEAYDLEVSAVVRVDGRSPALFYSVFIV